MRRVWPLALKPPAGEFEMRNDGGADHAARLDRDFQPTVPPQANRSLSLSRGSNMPSV
jgi:hypothetical protein